MGVVIQDGHGHPGAVGLAGSVAAQLKAKGFKESMEEGDPICAMRLNGLRVDFMPDDPATDVTPLYLDHLADVVGQIKGM